MYFKTGQYYMVGDILNVITGILIVSWAVGFFALSLGSFIHLFLLIALITLVFKVYLVR